MRAALMLTSKNYRAQPMRDIKVKSKPTGRERTYGLPTYFDRAMQVLYSFSLAPVLEAWGERKSFAFRVGRSALDANAYILEALQGKYAPELVDIIDVKAYYSNIQQNWLMDNTPMDKKVLNSCGPGMYSRGNCSRRKKSAYRWARTFPRSWRITCWTACKGIYTST